GGLKGFLSEQMSVLPQFVVVAETLVQHGVALALRHVFELAGLEIAQTDVFHWGLRQKNARTSTGARQATTALRPHATASSMFAAFRIQKPPMCSLVSRYGPSVTRTLPSGCARRDFALLAAERPPAKDLAPAASISSLSTSISRSIALVSRDAS